MGYSDLKRKSTGKTLASTYGYAAIPFLALGLGGAGVAIYANANYKKNYDKYVLVNKLLYSQKLHPIISYLMLIESKGKTPRIYQLEAEKYDKMRLYTSIASGVTGGVAIILGIVWLAKLSEEGKISASGDININRQFALTLPPQYYNDCFNYSKRNQYGFGLGLNMRF